MRETRLTMGMPTAAFAMGRHGIAFIEAVPGLDGYAIDREGVATMSSGFNRIALS